jgi:putative ATP-binding cassette transporter
MTKQKIRLTVALTFLRRVWQLASPYWSSEERWRARGLLALVILLTLAQIVLTVFYNMWNRSFFTAIQNKDFASFGPLLVQFGILAGLYILAAVYALYFTQMLQMRWRVWMTHRFMREWVANQAYYQLEITGRRTDNPDQRISDDLSFFTSNTLDLGLGLLSSAVTLVSFVSILWVISGPLPITLGPISFSIPGYMVWVAALYAAAGTLSTHFLGRPLIPLNFRQQRLEADFRFGLVRIRENAEGVALHHGESPEQAALVERVEGIRGNWWQLMNFPKRLTFFTAGYSQIASIFPVLVAAPRYFLGAITLGVLTQIGDAFGRVQGALSWFISSCTALASWKATADRLLTFREAMQAVAAQAAAGGGIECVMNGVGGVDVHNVDLNLPDGRQILRGASLSVARGEHLLITGPTGSGKNYSVSGAGRHLAVWPRKNRSPKKRPRVVLAPTAVHSDRQFARGDQLSSTRRHLRRRSRARRDPERRAGVDAGPARRGPELEHAAQWRRAQRLAIGRALLHRPDWLFLDEATAALDAAGEAQLYQQIRERLPETAVVSIAHRDGVQPYHDSHVHVGADGHIGATAGRTLVPMAVASMDVSPPICQPELRRQFDERAHGGRL